MKYIQFFLLLCCPFIFATSCGEEPRPALSPSGAAASANHLELLPPGRTGVDFVQTITEEYRYNFNTDPNIFNGGGVAVLDANNDGLPDLFFTSRLQPCRLYLNRGDFRFEDVSEQAGVSKFIGIKTGATVTDINTDGWPDIYVCRTFLTPIPERRNLLFVNQKDGTFAEEAAKYGLDDLSPTQHALFLDYDLDGDLDCYLLNHPVEYTKINTMDFLPTAEKPLASASLPNDEFESDKLLRNDGGTFTDVTATAGITNRAWGLSAAAADLNNDGWPDIYVANDFIMPDFFYLNNGDGTFSEKGQPYFRQMTNHAMGTEVADLTNDGLPEVAALDMLGENWERRHRQLTTMQRERYHQLLRRGYGSQQMRNTLQLNLGSGQFAEMGCLAGMFDTEWSWAPLAADLDLDGWKELLITNGVRRDLNDIDFFTYTADSINRAGGIRESVFPTFEDFSSLMPSQKIPNRVFRNTGALQLEDVTEPWGLGQPTFSNGAAYADLDNDGDLDLVIHNVGDPPSIYRNHAVEESGRHWLQIACKGAAGNPAGLGAKIWVTADSTPSAVSSGDGSGIQYHEMATVRGFYSSVQPLFQVGLGEKTQAARIEIEWPGGGHQVLENVPADQRIALDVADAKPGRLPKKAAPKTILTETAPLKFTHRENPFEDFDRERLLPHRFSRLGPCLATADVDGDGLDDVFVGGARGQAGGIFLQKKDASFAEKTQPALQADADFEDTGALFFDADGDGDPDLYVVSGGNELPAGDASYQDRFYQNDGGKFTLKKEALPTETASGKAIAAHDLDSDGDLDLVVGGRVVSGQFPLPPRTFVLKNEGGKFTDWTDEAAPALRQIGMVTALQFADLDGDGQAELIVAGEWMSVQVFKISKEKNPTPDAPLLTSQPSPLTSNGWWNCLTVSDLDGDGDPDIVAGNLGLNTRYEASPAAKMELWAKDFDANGSIDPIVCVSENGRTLPVPMRDDLIKQLPHLKKKFVRNTRYAEADLEGVFSKKELQGALHLTTEALATTWFENRGGEWLAHPLPDRAQLAPAQAILAEDVDGDGHLDLLVVGNDAGHEVETGPLTSSPGCLLLGDGKGGFRALPPGWSGLWATQEARALVQVKTAGGRMLWLVGNCEGEVQGFVKK